MWGLMLMTAGAWQETVWFSKQVMPWQNILSLICELSVIRPWTSHCRLTTTLRTPIDLKLQPTILNTTQYKFLLYGKLMILKYRVKTPHLTPLVSTLQILFERGQLSAKTKKILDTALSSVMKEQLASDSEFWSSNKTLTTLSERNYFENGTPETLKKFLSDCKW